MILIKKEYKGKGCRISLCGTFAKKLTEAGYSHTIDLDVASPYELNLLYDMKHPYVTKKKGA